MSEIAVIDNNVPESKRMNGSFNNGSIGKIQVEGVSENTEERLSKGVAAESTEERLSKGMAAENTEERLSKGVAAVVDTSIKIEETEIPAAVEVEYVEAEDLKDVEDVDDCVNTLLSGLSSKDWVLVCNALNNVRRLCIFHKEAISSMLDEVISLVVKSLKNPRSAVCKTGIMTAADLFKEYNDIIIDSLDPLLVQLLLKSSQDKKFVCEAAESALIALTSWVSPILLLPKLQPYVKNRNPKIRAKASMCISRSVSRLGVAGIDAFGIEKLIEIGASQLNDRLPESRDAARTLLLELQSAYEKSHVPESTDEPEQPIAASWEVFCQSKLSPLSAQAVLRVINAAPREEHVTG